MTCGFMLALLAFGLSPLFFYLKTAECVLTLLFTPTKASTIAHYTYWRRPLSGVVCSTADLSPVKTG